MDLRKIEKIITTPMSVSLVDRYFDKKPIVKLLSDLSHDSSIEQVFGKYRYFTLYIAIKSQYGGHFQCFWLNKDNVLCFFDSYGLKMDKLINTCNGRFGQNTNILTLIKKSKLKVMMNTSKFQGDGNVQTCGRYCTMVLILRHIYEKSFGIAFYPSMIKPILTYLAHKKNLSSFDEVVSYYINKS